MRLETLARTLGSFASIEDLGLRGHLVAGGAVSISKQAAAGAAAPLGGSK